MLISSLPIFFDFTFLNIEDFNYLNICKEIIILGKQKNYYLFITHSDYSIRLYNTDQSIITINIQTTLQNEYSLNGSDLIYNYRINLYEYYFNESFSIDLPNQSSINLKNTEEFNISLKIPNLGLKQMNNQRGDLYIYKQLDLTLLNKNNYQKILKEIFN